MTKWQNKIQVYLDPLIKQNNKAIVSKLESLILRNGFISVGSLDEIKAVALPIVFIFEEENAKKLARLRADSKNYSIQIDQPNLDLFANQSIVEDTFILKELHDIENIFENLLFLIEQDILVLMNQYIEKSTKILKLLLSKKKIDTLKETANSQGINQFETSLYEVYNIESLSQYVSEESMNVFGIQFTLIRASELLYNNTTENFLPLKISADNYLFLNWDAGASDEQVILIYLCLDECLKNHRVLHDSIDDRKKWDKALSSLPIPIVIIDSAQEIIIHNKPFSSLNLSTKDCLGIKHNHQLTFNKKLYRVLRAKLKNEFEEFTFIPVDEFLVNSENPSFEELGIISSSIAHELNNPLAGISAALDILLLDEFSDDITEELLEMKKGGERCRKLIETFLGFTKVSTNKNDSGEVTTQNGVNDCLDQAMELIRFRLIENGFNLKINYQLENPLEKNINTHVLTMLFYLLLGDIMTNLSHHSLVVRKDHKLIELEVEENRRFLRIKFDQNVTVNEKFADSKLVMHLFELLQVGFYLTDDCAEISI
jgi:hypothetical protein